MTKSKFFNNKQEYLNFKQSWANAVNSPKTKSTLIPCYEWHQDKFYNLTRSKEKTGRELKKGWITSSHILLYNILCNKPITLGFNKITNKTKIENGIDPYVGLKTSVYNLNRIINYLDTTITKQTIFDYNYKTYKTNEIAKLLDPFNRTVTKQMLTKISMMPLKQQINKELNENIYNIYL